VLEVDVYLNDLDAQAVRVEVYANGVDDGAPLRQEMERVGYPPGAAGATTYRARVSASHPVTDYTARLIPCHEGVAIPLEAAHILWQR